MVKSRKKEEVFRQVEDFVTSVGLEIQSKDKERPWGGFFVIKDKSLPRFQELFFTENNTQTNDKAHELSPKILVVEPGKRLSWQYHNRRSELWTITEGEVGVITSETDEQKPVKILKKGDTIHLQQGVRHRLVGLDEWCVVAEIWQHTDPENPSDEDDIIRVEDDFGR